MPNSPFPRQWLLSAVALSFCLIFAGCSSSDNDKQSPLQSGGASSTSSPDLDNPSSAGGNGSSEPDVSSSNSSSGGGVVQPEEEPISINVAVDDPTLPINGRTPMTLTFADSDGNALSVPGTWTASSPCLSTYDALLSGPVVTDSSVEFIYAVHGCEGEDVVTFTGVDGDDTHVVETSITVEDRVVGIEWVESNPGQIALRNTFGEEIAKVTFRVKGYFETEGVAGQEVLFRLAGQPGDVELVNESALSDEDGFVTATVKSGTTPSVVTVVAHHVLTGEEIHSDGLAVATGLPTHFNMALKPYNPNAWDRLNAEPVDVIVTATDRFGNPVVDGTVVNFVSPEGGSVTPSCQTENNTCTVQWKPDGRQPDTGRLQIFATVKGQEDYIDINGNGIFDDGDEFAGFDLGEPFTDNNQDGAYVPGFYFVDINGDGVRDSDGDGVWNGPNCQHSALCPADPADTAIDLAAQQTLYLSDGSNPTICQAGDFPSVGGVPLVVPVDSIRDIGGLYLSDGNSMADDNGTHPCATGNPLPHGTTVSFSATGGALRGKTSWTIGDDATRPTGSYNLNIKAPSDPSSELLTLTVTVPEEIEVTWTWVLDFE